MKFLYAIKTKKPNQTSFHTNHFYLLSNIIIIIKAYSQNESISPPPLSLSLSPSVLIDHHNSVILYPLSA